MNYFPVNLSFRIWSILILTSAFICLPSYEWNNTDIDIVSAAELTFSSSVGYNSNPALKSKASETSSTESASTETESDTNIEGSPFSIHTLSLEHGFSIAEKFTVDVSPSVTYQNIWDTPDNHQLDLGISLSPLASGKRFTPYLFTNIFIYRDSMLSLDNRDEFTFGVGGEIMLSGRYNLAFENAWQRVSYLEDAPIFFLAGRDLRVEDTNRVLPIREQNTIIREQNRTIRDENTNKIEPLNRLINQLQEIYKARDDVNMLLKTRLDIFLLPSLTASAGLKYDYLVSSLDPESFWQLTPDIKVVWDFASQWQLVTSAELGRKKYFNIYEAFENRPVISIISGASDNNPNSNLLDIRDVNYTTSINLRLVYFWSDIEVFTDFLIEHGEYPLNRESYNQKVMQCGFSWSF